MFGDCCCHAKFVLSVLGSHRAPGIFGASSRGGCGGEGELVVEVATTSRAAWGSYMSADACLDETYSIVCDLPYSVLLVSLCLVDQSLWHGSQPLLRGVPHVAHPAQVCSVDGLATLMLV